MTETWSRSKLIAGMPAFDFNNLPELTEEAKRYCRYYKIDFCETLPEVKHYLGSFDTLGYRMAMHYYSPETVNGTVFIFHGYFDHVGLYGHLIKHCLENNLAVVAYDLPGHGLSSGRATAIKSFDDYQWALQRCIGLCKDNVTGPYYGIGQSTGGAVLIDHFLNRTQQASESFFKKGVLLAPLVRPMGWKGALLLHSAVGPFVSTWKRVFSANSNDPEFIKFLKTHDPLQSQIMSIEWISALRKWIKEIENTASIDGRILIIQGQRDMTVDWRHNISVLQQNFSDVDVHYLPKGRHHLVNESEDIRQKVFSLIDAELALT